MIDTVSNSSAPTADTVKNPLTRKRDKRVVENDDFAAFARRILRAYSRRIANGDVEALRSLTRLSSDVDALTREAVQGLRTFGYSWAEIADRLGITRQAAQQRWGNPSDRGALDRRILAPGMTVNVNILATVYAEHHPGTPTSASCPGCGYPYPPNVTDCPTNVVVRPLLVRRRHEDPKALARLTPDQLEDLLDGRAARANRSALRQAATRTTVTARPSLFDQTEAGTP